MGEVVALAEFDVIVVGAGPSGAATALTLARRGANVLMLEKAKIPGERNMTGGVLYGTFEGHYGLLDLVPDFEATAPVQRRVVSHEVSVLSDPDWEEGTYRRYTLTRSSLASRLGLFRIGVDSGHDYSVLRRDFDQWFANRAVDEGAMLSTQTTVEELLKEDGMVVGVRTTHEDLRAKLVVDASGVTSNLVEMAGLRGRLVPKQLYHGLKHVFKLDPSLIEERFGVGKEEGKAQLYLGSFMRGVNGGAFIYTNRDTLSVGIVVSMESMVRVLTEDFGVGKALDILQEFEGHPMIAKYLAGAELVEYSAHNVPKGYKCILDTPFADGYLASGDALGAFVKIGPLLDGMRRGIATGIMAAEAYLSADRAGSFRSASLARYKSLLAPIYRDVGRSKRDSRVSESNFVYQRLPQLIFSFSPLSHKVKIDTPKKREDAPSGDAIKRVQAGTSLLNYDEDEIYSHIEVNTQDASRVEMKPWVPCCPVNCYTLVTSKGIYASYKDLFDYNAAPLRDKQPNASGLKPDASKAVAARETRDDVASGELRFDHIACVACGTCGEIGPPELVAFTHERDGHGVRYRYG